MKYDSLQQRLLSNTVSVLKLSKRLPNDIVNRNLIDQISRSSSSTTLNYAEATAAESRRDFIHKMQIVLKELRETQVCLQIILGINNDLKIHEKIETSFKETSELIAIFVKSIKTAKSKK